MDLSFHYGVDRVQFARLDEEIRKHLAVYGVTASLASLEGVVETDVYAVDRALQPAEAHHETCISDGLRVWLHDQIEHVGGECSRLHDLLRVGCGHLFQWAAGADSGLEFHGERVWEIASTSCLNASEERTEEVRRYELEAARLAQGESVADSRRGASDPFFAGAVTRMVNDYAVTDLDYITSFYRTGKVLDIFSGWQWNGPMIPRLAPDFVVRPVRRKNRCVALIRGSEE